MYKVTIKFVRLAFRLECSIFYTEYYNAPIIVTLINVFNALWQRYKCAHAQEGMLDYSCQSFVPD